MKTYDLKEARMIARIAGTVILCLVVFILVSLLGFLGVLWLTGGTVRAATIGAVCGLAVAFVVGAASTAGRRTERTSCGETNDNYSGLQGRRSGRSGPEQDDQQRSDPEVRQQ
jgi:hypothetical protein